MEAKFKIGDTVKLNITGIRTSKMIVNDITDIKKVECIWFAIDELKIIRVHQDTLIRADSDSD